MVSVAVWSAPRDGGPRRLIATSPHTEAALEEWVRADPALVRDGLVVVAQQFVFPTRERLDLLCIENRSRWLVVELKRDRMAREVAAQALDYVSLISDMSTEDLASRLDPHLQDAPDETKQLVTGLLESEEPESPREVSAVVVGTTADEPLLRITRYLSEHYDVPLAVVQLQGFLSPSGDLLIIREETGTDESTGTATEQTPRAATEGERWARVQSYAEESGFGAALREAQEILKDVRVYLRPYTRSVMIAPLGNRTPLPRGDGLRGRKTSPRHRGHQLRQRRPRRVLPQPQPRPDHQRPRPREDQGQPRPACRLLTTPLGPPDRA